MANGYIIIMEIQIKYKDRIEKIVPSNNLINAHQLKALLVKTFRIPLNQIELSIQNPEDKKKKVLKDDDVISNLNLSNQTINLKNLGKQISWRTVFLIEYGGPLIIFPILRLISGDKGDDFLRNTLFWMVIIHFVKRQLETIYVHVFSHSTMPFKRVYINSVHYWVFCALMIGVQLFFFWKNPGYSKTTIFALLGAWGIFQFMNLMCHITTSRFRKSPGASNTTRGIPKGWGFDLVSCANYFWEIMGWATFAALSRTYASYFFLGLSAYQMTVWALDKHRKYRKEFKEYPRSRKAIFPFIL